MGNSTKIKPEFDDVGSAIAEAVRDYQTVFPVPYKLSPNLRLAVDALAERDRAEATLARVREALSGWNADHGDNALWHEIDTALTEETK